MGVFRRTSSVFDPTSQTLLTSQDVLDLVDARMAGSNGESRDVETRTMTTAVTLSVTSRFWQIVSTSGTNQTLTVPAGNSNWIKKQDSGILTVLNSAGGVAATLTQGKSALVLWDIETASHYVIDSLISSGSSAVSYVSLDVSVASSTLNFAPADGDLVYVHRIDTTSGTNAAVIDATSAGLTIVHNDVTPGATVLSATSGGLYLFKRVGTELRLLLPETLSAAGSPVLREARINVSGAILSGTIMTVNASGANYSYSGSTAFNLGASSGVFDSNSLMRFLLNGVEQVNGVDVLWVSSTSFSFPLLNLSSGDSLVIKEMKF